MCKWNTNCKYESDENCYECDYSYIKTEDNLKEYLKLGDKVQSKITGAIGEVIEISEDKDIKVLEDNGSTSVFSSDNALI